MPTPAQKLRDHLARGMPAEAAASWLHVAVLTRHAVLTGLVDADPGSDGADRIRRVADRVAAAHPALAALADPAVVPAWAEPVPADDAAAIHAWADTRPLATGSVPSGYQLGDLWQELSVAGKARALCQTPRFVADLLLNLAADPALTEYGSSARMIDPACGTGHVLLAAALRWWISDVPKLGSSAQRWEFALRAVHGVDIDPYAALLARYRLLALTCRLDGRHWRLTDVSSDLSPRVAVADSLLDDHPYLGSGLYHAVVGNPPYVTIKDAATNTAARARWPEVCNGKFSAALPFTALMTELAVPGGWVAQITANAFMKREYGRRFVEGYLPRFDLRWVIDTSGAYIPGHGTPTVILVHRNRPPSKDAVAVIQGVSGESSRPADPAKGVVWTAIERAVRERCAFERLATKCSQSVSS